MSFHVERIAATRLSAAAPELVLLHGWGMSSAVWRNWLPFLRAHCNVTLLDLPGYGASAATTQENIDELLNALLAVLPQRAVYVGYSLGGMFATRLAARFPERVAALVTFASNAKFVSSESWPWAMPAEAYEQFYNGLAKPSVLLKRFAGLQAHGCHEEKQLLKNLRAVQEDLPEAVLRTSLHWLNAIDNSSIVAQLSMPALFCFAENDALVPAAAAEHFPAGQTIVLSDTAHAMFHSQPQQCADMLLNFLSQQQLLLPQSSASLRNKQDVARSFGRAAETYDSVAALQRQVGSAVVERLSPLKVPTEGVVVDLGCGTGYFQSSLQQHFPDRDIVGIDLAEGMVKYAASHRQQGYWLCGDAENLPLADQSAALVFSTLTIQWCENLNALFAEIYRVLRPGGVFVFSTLGPDTLHELRSAWQCVDDYVHVNGFSPWQEVRAAIASAGFTASPQPDEELMALEYDSFSELARELKSLGAHNVNSGRPEGLTGRRRLRQLTEGYERQRNAKGLLPATYQVWYGVLGKGDLNGG